MLRSAQDRASRGPERCAADPGSILFGTLVPALRCIVKNAAPHPGHELSYAATWCRASSAWYSLNSSVIALAMLGRVRSRS